MVRADLRAMRGSAIAVVVLVALAVAIGIAVGAQERAIRQGTARAADDFPLLVGAPGSQTQLVLTSVFLQPEALPLVEGALLNRLAADPRVAGVAPIAFGDIVRGWPVVGTTRDFAARWGRLTPTEGHLFAAEDEAIIGADVRLRLGERVTPSHGTAGHAHPGEETEEEHAHRHEGVQYEVVGRLPRLGSPWDRAILVPVESVWETHGLGNGHEADPAPLGPPFEAGHVPGVPALVVKPRGVADAYALRAQYRQGGTMALFPAEVLVSLYRTVGDVRDALVLASALNNLLVFAAVLLLSVTLVSLRRRRYAVLRALGAPRGYVLLVTWLGAASLLTAGCVAGLLTGWAASYALSEVIAAQTGLHLSVAPGWPELSLTLLLIGAGSLLSLAPALAAWRAPVSASLRGG
ncbi:ABC transporter permease [Rhodovastum atsumiense]|uniref:ABC transporter permease n=2 Tax=Rhodovastum atsumiense TaxID=504468 RepID=A0A5M6J0Z8_9PROT|nr:ABC transporter permease [Rhodovastum atsumiense]